MKKVQSVNDRSCSNPKLKALNPTRRSGRCDAVYALKERFCDVMKCLTHIILTSTKPKGMKHAHKAHIVLLTVESNITKKLKADWEENVFQRFSPSNLKL